MRGSRRICGSIKGGECGKLRVDAGEECRWLLLKRVEYVAVHRRWSDKVEMRNREDTWLGRMVSLDEYFIHNAFHFVFAGKIRLSQTIEWQGGSRSKGNGRVGGSGTMHP